MASTQAVFSESLREHILLAMRLGKEPVYVRGAHFGQSRRIPPRLLILIDQPRANPFAKIRGRTEIKRHIPFAQKHCLFGQLFSSGELS